MAVQSASVLSGRPTPESPRLLRLAITGFQGNRKLSIRFDEHVNFLIGRNGCGKTTLINIINAALSGDHQTLIRSRFSELRLTLTFGPTNSQYTLEYQRQFTESTGTYSLSTRILGPRDGELAARRIRERDRDLVPYRGAAGADSERPLTWRSMFAAAERIPPQVTWLSILRWEINRAGAPGDVMASPIDKKLDELAIRSSRYLSSLDSRSSLLSAAFQKDYYLSLIGYKQDFGVIEKFHKLNLDEEENTLELILSHLNIPTKDYSGKSENHFSLARQVSEKAHGPGYTIVDLQCILDTLRIHELNEKWLAFDTARTSIYKSKSDFTDIINSLFTDKKLKFDDRNQPHFELDEARLLGLQSLSSGEKQAYIILSEALVQEGRRAIYLADEPELSLHIEWQQYLVENLLVINPSCQLIFATHSPDILGAYGSRAINLELS